MPPTNAPTPAADADKPAQANTTGDDVQTAETDWKALARKWEARAKANQDAAQRLAALEDAQKTDAQKNADALAKATADLEAANARVKAYEAAARTGVPVDLLVASDGDVDALADRFAAWRDTLTATDTSGGKKDDSAKKEPAPKGQPVPSQGKEPEGSGVMSINEQITAAEKAGDALLVKTLKAMKLGDKKA
ncbi:hypothetical protein [Actinobaculum sp. 352]|uniref:hypothetical protein n=1 Tax=Actinobaculum sp. 352 TaxID=2490946 RepID=UPI000F7F0194|nr:hypothetical protein [Actinobaculum sp. 352]RTE48820.1 hypothetical protein EKN07_08945 [Actinobaculum sp. 352]